MRRSLAVALLVGLSASLVTAQTTPTTRLIPYSGTAADANGAPLGGTVALVFELYEAQEGGTPLWRETQQVEIAERGRYAVYLGAVRPIPQIAFREERARWLAVTIEDRPQPRVMLVAVPYALRAADAETLGGQPAASFVRSRADGRLETSAGLIAADAVEGSGVMNQLAKFSAPTTLSSSIITESATNRIGVGLPDPTGGGVVDSVFTIRNFDNNTGFAVLNQGQQRRFALNTLANGGFDIYDGGSSMWNLGLRQLGGKVAIGTNSFAAKITVWGDNAPAALFVSPTPGVNTASVLSLAYALGPALSGEKVNPGGVAIQASAGNNSSDLFLGRSLSVDRFRVGNTGAVFAASYTIGGADFAEEIDPVGDGRLYEPGDVLAIADDRDRSVIRASVPYATTVLGIYSTQPGIIASPYSMDDPQRDGKLPVAMVGIVPCKVSAENGPIARGDLLVSSSTVGHAMKGTDRSRMTGAIIGKALEPLPGGTGKILIAVTLQ